MSNDASWVTPDPGDHACERCEHLDTDVFALKLIYDQPTYVCYACLSEARDIAYSSIMASTPDLIMRDDGVIVSPEPDVWREKVRS